MGAPGLDKNGSARRDSHDDYDPFDPTRGSICKSRKFQQLNIIPWIKGWVFFFSEEPAVVNMDPNQSGLMARIAMRHGNYPEALRHLSMALRHIPPQLTQFGAPLLADRAECFWQLGHAEEAVQDIMDAFSIGLPRDAVNSEVNAIDNCFFIEHL